MKKRLFTLFLFIVSFNLMAQTNIVPNGNMENWDSFDTNPDDWYRFLNGFWEKSSDSQNGSSSLQLEIDSDRTFIFINSPDIQFTTDITYVCTFYYKVISGNVTKFEFNLVHTPNVFHENLVVNEFTDLSTTEWKKGEFEFTSSASENVQAFIYVRGDAGSKTLIDNVSIIESTLSIADFSNDINKLNVYPNPSKNVIKISGVEDIEHYTIYSISGKEVSKGIIIPNTQINISNLTRGIYILKTEKGKVSKIVKE